MKIKIIFCSLIAVCCSCVSRTDGIRGESHRPAVPVLALKTGSPVLQLRLTRQDSTNYLLEKVEISFEGTTDINDVDSVGLFPADESGMPAFRIPLAPMQKADEKVVLHPNYRIDVDTLICWVAVRLKDSIDLTHRIKASCTGIRTDAGKVDITPPANEAAQRVGVALRQHMQDGVHTSRIPGLTTSKKGTLLAIYDARRQSGRDLQGDIDIALNRSADGGRTWSPMQVVLDMGPWGGLPEKYNGVSDACILADDNTGDLYVFGLWMHGVLDSRTGKWVEGLTDTSTVWNHQWRSRGSGPGYGVRQTPQLLVTKSTDDGLTWSTPENITRQVKEAGWWLLAPAPGRGITLADGTLVFPSEGRGETGGVFFHHYLQQGRRKNVDDGQPGLRQYERVHGGSAKRRFDHAEHARTGEPGTPGRKRTGDRRYPRPRKDVDGTSDLAQRSRRTRLHGLSLSARLHGKRR